MAARKRKSAAASDVSEADRTCEFCGHEFNTKGSYKAHCNGSQCAVENRGASTWKCNRCNMRSAHRKTIAKHMKEKCWETCEECAEAGLEKCDAAKREGSCTSCVGNGVACTKLPKGEVTDGSPVEIPAAESSNGEGSEDAHDEEPEGAHEEEPEDIHEGEPEDTLEEEGPEGRREEESEDIRANASHAQETSQNASVHAPQPLLAVEAGAARNRDDDAHMDAHMEGHETEPEGTQVDASHVQNASQNASGQDPQQPLAVEANAVRDRDGDTYMQDYEDEPDHSKQEAIQKDGTGKEGTQDTPRKGLPVQHDSSKPRDESDTAMDGPKTPEPSREDRSPNSPGTLSQSHDTNAHHARGQTLDVNINPHDLPRTSSPSVFTVTTQAQAQPLSEPDLPPRRRSTALSLVDRAFLSSTEQENRNEPAQKQFPPSKQHSLQPATLPSHPATPMELVNPSLSSRATSTPHQTLEPPLQQQVEVPVTPAPASASPPWWISIPEIASTLEEQRRRPAPSGLSNDFTAFYASVLEETDYPRSRRRT